MCMSGRFLLQNGVKRKAFSGVKLGGGLRRVWAGEAFRLPGGDGLDRGGI